MCTCTPVARPSSKISRSAIVSAIGGRVWQWAIGSVLPLVRASRIRASTSSWFSLWIAIGRLVSAISRKAATIVGGSMRGKRTGSYS